MTNIILVLFFFQKCIFFISLHIPFFGSKNTKKPEKMQPALQLLRFHISKILFYSDDQGFALKDYPSSAFRLQSFSYILSNDNIFSAGFQPLITRISAPFSPLPAHIQSPLSFQARIPDRPARLCAVAVSPTAVFREIQNISCWQELPVRCKNGRWYAFILHKKIICFSTKLINSHKNWVYCATFSAHKSLRPLALLCISLLK